jgi:hypothetical protein
MTAALAGLPRTAHADVVTDWNTIAVSTVSAERVVNRQSRDMAMVHAAMFDAMNAIRPHYTPAIVRIRARGYASREAAAAQAAHDVLVALFPAQQVDLDADLVASLAQIPNDHNHGVQPKRWGVKTGHVAAAAVLAARQNDHAFDSASFTPSDAAGEYAFTPGCTASNLSAPGWGEVTPFTAPDPDYFPTAARPALDDPEWLASLEEVRAYGAADSTVRTAEQLEIGLFYIEPSVASMNRLARQLVAQEPIETDRPAAAKQLLAHARLFAALDIALADTYIRTWRVKYREHFWRPYTAINFIYPGTNWTPARQTPCHPEFYSGHSSLTPAAISAIQHYLGRDDVDVMVTSTSLPGITRHYASLNQIIEDAKAARIYTGFHYRSTLIRSAPLGIAVANWVDEHMMVALDARTTDRDDEDSDGHYVGIPVEERYDLDTLDDGV